MTETSITVSEAARSFNDCVNRAHFQNQSFVLLKDGVPFARLVPAGLPVCRGRDLAEALGSAELSEDEAREWSRELMDARSQLEAPQDKWQ